MIRIYYCDDHDGILIKNQCNVAVDDNEATLAEVINGLIKVAKFAGYNSLSFDNLVIEYVREMLKEKESNVPLITSEDVEVDKDYTFEDFILDRTYN